MDAVATLEPVECIPAERLLTIADVAALPSDLPSGAVRYELDDGRLIIMAPAGDFHGAYESNLVVDLKLQGERKGYGKARCGEVGIILGRGPDKLVGADALFICNARLPIKTSPEGYLETIPDLVAEVRSKNDRLAAVAEQGGQIPGRRRTARVGPGPGAENRDRPSPRSEAPSVQKLAKR